MAPNKQTYMTDVVIFKCRSCNTRFTVLSGVLDKCPDCGRELEYAGLGKMVEVMSDGGK